MTICIATISDKGKCYTAVSDRMITLEGGSGFVMSGDDMEFKSRSISRKWMAMYSGSSSLADSILSEAKATFTADDIPLDEMSENFNKIYQRHLTKHVTDSVLSPFGWDRDEFYDLGLEKLGPTGFVQARAAFEEGMRGDPELDFLVVGCGADGEMHIFSLTNPGVVRHHKSFWAIGIGQEVALSSLMFHRHSIYFDVPRSIYHTLEAKFMAERVPAVGKSTVCMNVDFRRGERPFWGLFGEIGDIREIWEKKGKPTYPDEAHKKLSEMFSSGTVRNIPESKKAGVT